MRSTGDLYYRFLGSRRLFCHARPFPADLTRDRLKEQYPTARICEPGTAKAGRGPTLTADPALSGLAISWLMSLFGTELNGYAPRLHSCDTGTCSLSLQCVPGGRCVMIAMHAAGATGSGTSGDHGYRLRHAVASESLGVCQIVPRSAWQIIGGPECAQSSSRVKRSACVPAAPRSHPETSD